MDYANTDAERQALKAMSDWLRRRPGGRINPLALIKKHSPEIPALVFFEVLDRLRDAGVVSARYAMVTPTGLLTDSDFDSIEQMSQSDLFDHHDDPIKFDNKRVMAVYRPVAAG